jgi:hypothetical protein
VHWHWIYPRHFRDSKLPSPRYSEDRPAFATLKGNDLGRASKWEGEVPTEPKRPQGRRPPEASGGRRAEARLGSVGTSPSRIQALELAASPYYEMLQKLDDLSGGRGAGLFYFPGFSMVTRLVPNQCRWSNGERNEPVVSLCVDDTSLYYRLIPETPLGVIFEQKVALEPEISSVGRPFSCRWLFRRA